MVIILANTFRINSVIIIVIWCKLKRSFISKVLNRHKTSFLITRFFLRREMRRPSFLTFKLNAAKLLPR